MGITVTMCLSLNLPQAPSVGARWVRRPCAATLEEVLSHTPILLTGIVFPADKSGPVTASEIDGSAEGVETLIDGQTEAVMGVPTKVG